MSANYAWVEPVIGYDGWWIVRNNADEGWHLQYLRRDGSQGFPEWMPFEEADQIARAFNDRHRCEFPPGCDRPAASGKRLCRSHYDAVEALLG